MSAKDRGGLLEGVKMAFTNQLEALVDRKNLGDVFMDLSEIAQAKSYHISDNWQDARLSKRWKTASKMIARCAMTVTRLGI